MLYFSLKYNIDVLNNLYSTLLDTLHGIRASESICLCHSVRHGTPTSASRTFRICRFSHCASRLSSLSYSSRICPLNHSSRVVRLSHSACLTRLSHSSRVSRISHPASRASSASNSRQRHSSGREQWTSRRGQDSEAHRIRRDRLPPSVQEGTPL